MEHPGVFQELSVSITSGSTSMRKLVLALSCALACASVFAAAAPATVKGEVSVESAKGGRSTVVTVKQGADIAAQFCIHHVDPLSAPLTMAAKGAVVYVPQPIPGLPPGVKISGPEQIAPTLAVVPEKSAAILFLGKGAAAPTGVDTKSARKIAVSTVVRQDWVGPNGARRGTGVEACLAPGG
jgi:hypothetical protein